MTLYFQEVDPDDLSTLLFDYNDPTGANNIGSVKTKVGLLGAFNIGAPAVSIDTSDRNGDGIPDLTFSYDEIVQSSFSFWMQYSSYDVGRTALGTLQRLLQADGVIRYVPEGSSNTYYIYRKPSSIPALLSGKDGELNLVMSQLQTPQGIDIVINRERLIRGATLLASVNKAQNPTLLLASGSSGTGQYQWDWDSATSITTGGYAANVSWANQSYRFTIATTGTRNFQQSTPAGTASPGDIWTLSFYAKASGGTLCKARAVLEFINSGTTVLATATGTLTTLSSTEQRLTITSSSAPANTDHMRLNLRWTNGDTATYTVDARRVQVEKASSASQFRVGSMDTVRNALTGAVAKSLFVYNPGDANALARLTMYPSTGSNTVAVNLARRSEGLDVNLSEAVNPTAASTFTTRAFTVAQTMYAGNAGDTSSVADAASTNGNAAKTTFSNQTSLVRRWRWVTVPTDAETLHGTWDVYVAVRCEVGSTTDTRYRVCLHWQAANRDPVTNTEDEIILDATDATSSKYVPLKLGTVTFDADAGDTALALEGWAAQDAGSGSLWWDVVYLVPADEQQTLLQVPGFRVGQQSTETWLGSELVTRASGCVAGASTPSGATRIDLDTQYEGVGTPPGSFTTGGVVWAAGRHEIKIHANLQENDGAATTLGALRIRKAPGPGNTVGTWAATTAYVIGDFVKPTAGNLAGRTFRCTTAGTSGGAEPSWTNTNGATTASGTVTFTETTVAHRQLSTKATFTSTLLVGDASPVVAYDADGITAYEGVVVQTAATLAGRKIHVLTAKHSTQRVVDTGYTAQMLGDLGVMQTANGTASIDDLVKQGPFITLGPGLNVLWIDLWSLPPQGYDDMTDEPLAFHDPTTYAAVGVDLIPMYWS